MNDLLWVPIGGAPCAAAEKMRLVSGFSGRKPWNVPSLTEET